MNRTESQMKELKLIATNTEESNSKDITIIVNAFAFFGEKISRIDAKIAWEMYSNTMAAGWLFLPDSQVEIYQSIRKYFMSLD